jgi:hypothetical protein
MPPGLRAYWNGRGKSKRGKRGKRKRRRSGLEREAGMFLAAGRRRSTSSKGASVSKPRKRRKSSSGRRTRRRSTGRGHGGGAGGGLSLANEAPAIIASGVVGWVEGQIKDAKGVGVQLAKLPTPIAQIGRLGNLALMAYAAAYFGRKFVGADVARYLRLGARSAAAITLYQLARQGKAFATGADLFTISGPHNTATPPPYDHHEGSAEHLLGERDIHAIAGAVEKKLRGHFEVDFDDAPDSSVLDGHDSEHDAEGAFANAAEPDDQVSEGAEEHAAHMAGINFNAVGEFVGEDPHVGEDFVGEPFVGEPFVGEHEG